MKNYLLLALAAVALCFTACKKDNPEPKPVAVTGVSLDKTMVGLQIGESATVQAVITPSNATNKAVEWSVADTAVATVANGVVTGVAVGETTLTATTTDGGHTATIPVKVVTEEVPVTGIKWFNEPHKEVKEGASSFYFVEISPANATDMGTIWKSSNPEVLSVGEIKAVDNMIGATIRGVAPGKATITATTNDGGFEVSCDVTVLEDPNNGEVTGVVPTSVTYNGSKNIDIVTWHGKKLEIVVDMEPAGADLRKLNWTKTLQTPHNPIEYSIEANRFVFESAPLGRYPYQFESCQHCIAYTTSNSYVFQVFARFRTKCKISRSASGMNSDGSINLSTFWDVIQIGLDGNEVAPALAMTMNAGTHYFVAWCPPSGKLPSSSAIYYPDAYIPTTEYTLTSDNAKWKVERVNDKLYKINDLDPTAYKEVVLTYTCGDFTFDQKFKVVPQ